jgi:hypothetical protein
MRAMMSTPPVLGIPIEARPIMSQMAEDEARDLVARTEPGADTHRADSWHTPASYRDVYGQPTEPFTALADSLRAFDGMTIDDLAALQTTR